MLGQTISHYRILDKLGEGGMGVVYVAEDILLERRVAIKTLNVEPGKQHYRQRFLREARAVSALHHPNIAVVHDYGETPDGKPYIVMELVEGQTLAELLSHGTLTLSRVLEIIEDVAKALAEAHRLGIIHRDIKPSNVIINERGDVKVLDFGLAKNVSDGAGEDAQRRAFLATQTREGVIVGTPMYLSPEQALGHPVDARSDLFSLGAVLYECISGQPAFPGTSAAEICAKVIRDNPPPPSHSNPRLSPELDHITLKALSKRPEERYQSASELLANLLAVREALQDERSSSQRLVLPSFRKFRAVPQTILSGMLRRPRHLMAAFLVTLAAGFVFWGISQIWSSRIHRPAPEGERLYREGVRGLLEGAYFQASRKLKSATEADNRLMVAYARLAEAWIELDYTDRAEEAVLQANVLANSEHSALSPQDSLYLQAINAVVLHDYGRAVEQYKQIVQQVSSENRNSALLDLGRAYEKNEAFDNAAKSYLEVPPAAPEYATAQLRLGTLYGRQQNFEKAQESFDQSERLFVSQGNYEGLTEVHYQRGRLLNSLNKTAEARTQLHQALDLARNTTYNKYQEIKVLLELSGAASIEGDTPQAKQLALEAMEAADNNNMPNLKTAGLIEIGNVFLGDREYVEAARFFKQAIVSAENHKGRANEAHARLSLASLYIQQEDNLDEGLSLVEQALAFYQRGGYRKEVWQAMLLRSRAKLQRGDYDSARQSLDELLQHAQKSGDSSLVADTHFEIGILLASQELYPQALTHFTESRSRYEVLGNSIKTGYSWLYCSDMQWRLGRYEDAQAALGQANSLAAQIKPLMIRVGLSDTQLELSRRNFPEAIARGQRVLGLIGTGYKRTAIEVKYTLGLALVLSKIKRGVKMCEEAVELAVGYRDPRLLSNSLLALAQAKLLNGNASEALQLARQATSHFERAGQIESEWQSNLIASLACNSLKDLEAARSYMLQADDLLKVLKQKWGEENFQSYLAREDVQSYIKQLKWAPDIAR